MSTYVVDVKVGDYGWKVTDDDPPVYGLADPLTLSWSIPDNAQRPAQPDPMVAQVNLAVPDATTVADLMLGDLVTIDIRFGDRPKNAPDVFFVGRIAQAQAKPHPQAMLYQLTCSDLTVDLNGFDLGVEPYPPAWALNQWALMLTRAGLTLADVDIDPVVVAGAGVVFDTITDPKAQDLLAATLQLWDQVGLDALDELAGDVYYRAIIAPAPGDSTVGVPYRWALDAVPDAYVPTAATPLPGVFGPYFPPPKLYGIWINPDDRAAGVIDACVVDYDSTWAAIIPSVVNRASVTWLVTDSLEAGERVTQVTYTDENPAPAGHPPLTAYRDTTAVALTSDPTQLAAAQANAQRLGHLMVPPPQNPAGWAPDTFRWLLYADPAGLADFPVVFPRHDATGQPTPRALRTAAYVRPIVVTPIPEATNPADPTREWVGGQLTGVQLTIAGGRPVVDFTLVPTIPPAGNPDVSAYTWDKTSGTWSAQQGTWDDREAGRPAFRWSDRALTPPTGPVRWEQLEPHQSWNTYRLARGSS